MPETITSHTPGPWVSESYVDECGLSVIASDDTDFISNPSRGQVCHVSIVAGASGDDEKAAKANARLIAAAPDLLEALKWVTTALEQAEAGYPDKLADQAIRRANMVIAAATGDPDAQ